MKQKTKRTLTCKPTWFEFGPIGKSPSETLLLPQDELEALYLADVQGLYHEECAKNLGVSRPTFAKLIKSARKKCAEMLLFHKKIQVVELAHAFTLVYPTDDRLTLSPNFNVAKYFAFAQVEDGSLLSITYKDNPMYTLLINKGITPEDDGSSTGLGAGHLIPPLLKEANLLACQKLGDGMLRNLQGLGINVEYTKEKTIDGIINSLL